jgi:hypothetical protein
MNIIQPCFICRPSDFTVSEDAGIEPRTVATSKIPEKIKKSGGVKLAQNLLGITAGGGGATG